MFVKKFISSAFDNYFPKPKIYFPVQKIGKDNIRDKVYWKNPRKRESEC